MLRVMPLNLRTWGICLAAAFLIIPLDVLRKAVTNARRKGEQA